MSETQPNPADQDPARTPGDLENAEQTREQTRPLKRARRRRWPWVVLVILLVLVGLVVLAPTIASTGPVRSFVVGKINENLNGRVAIDGWSLGWFSGIRASGVKVYDEKNVLIADVPRVTTDLTLMEAVRGNYDLGETQVDVANFIAEVDESGRTNFDKLVKETAPQPKDEQRAGGDEAVELPDVSGNVTLNIHQGTVETPGNPLVHVDRSTVALGITGINQPISNDVKLAFRVGEQQPGTVTAAGTVDVAENNRVDVEKLVADQKVSLSNVNLAAAAPFVPGVQLGGVGNGSLDVKAQGLTGISAAGEIVVDNFVAGGEPLNGDTFKTTRLALPVQITRTVDGDTTLIKIEKLGVVMPEATVAVAGQVSEQAVLNLLDNKKPGAAGDVRVNVNVPNIAAIANQLPNTLKLQEGVTIESGTLAQASHIVLTADDVIASQTLDLTAQGRNNNRPVQLSPIHLETSVTATPTGREMPSLSGLKLALTSAFATISGGGESLAAVKVKGNFDLDKLRNEAAQFADLGEVKLAGTGDFEVTTSGDPTNRAEPIAASAKLNLNNVTVAGVGTKPVQQERLAVVASGKLLRDQNVLQDGSLAVTSGDPRSPLLDLNATANVNLKDNSLPQFALAKLNVTDLRRVQDQFGAFVPALAENRIRIDGGALSATVAGSYAGDTLTMTQPLSATVSNLTVSRDGKPVLSRETIATNVNGTVSTKDGISGNLTDLSVTSQSNLVSLKKAGNGPLVFSMGPDGTPRGNGAIALAADLKRLNDLAQAFGGQVVAEGQPQLKSGLFNGTVTLAKADQPQTSIDFNGELTQVTVSSAAQGNALENEKVTITLKASVPDDLKGTTPVTADGQINSTFAETKLSNVRLLPGAGTWDMVQSATVNARIPDLPKLYALLNALAPPEAQPQVSVAPRPREEAPVVAVSFMQVRGDEPISRPRPQDRQQQQRPQPQPQPAPAPAAAEPEEPQEPLEITSGGATLALDVKRDPAKKTTSINVTDARVSQLGLRRGNRQYRFDREQPISFKLAAEVNAADAPDRTLVQQIQSLNVTQLAGDLRVATLAMPQPITVTNLAADTPTAKGGVRVEGELKNLTPLLSVLQGSNPLPYEGAYVVTQNVATEGNSITLDGEIAASGFRVLDPQNANQPVFTEDKLTVRNGITANPKDKVAQIRALNVDMASSGAVKLGVTGYVENWNGQVNGAPVLASVRELVADVSYDLEKLWPVVKPFVATPEDPEDPMNEVTVVGKHQKKFVVNGPYYTGETHEALREIQVVGDLTIDRFVYPGAELQNVQLPIYLRKGVAQVEYAGKSGRERMPPPAAFNGGTMSLGGIRVDLTRPDPRVTIPDKYKLVSGASINPLLGQTLGKYVNPIFPNSQQAKGLLDVQINYCRNVALGEKLTSADSGEAQVTFSLSDMDIANPTGSLMFGAIPGVSFGEGQADTFRGQIKEAVVTLANGVITEDVTLLLVDAGKAPADVIGSRQPVEPTPMPMRFQGTVRLEDLRQNINVSLPTGLLGRFFRSDKDREIFAKVFPEGVPMTLTGTTVKPKVDPGNIAQKILEGQVKGLIDPSKEGGAGSLLEDLLNRDRDRNKDRDPDRRNR